MKRLFLIIMLMAIIFSTSNQLGAQWTQTNGPEGGEVFCLAADDTTLFLGSEIGVYFSTDNGTSWTPVNFGLGNHNVHSLAVIDTNLFAGTEDGVFLSPSNDTYWIPTNKNSKL